MNAKKGSEHAASAQTCPPPSASASRVRRLGKQEGIPAEMSMVLGQLMLPMMVASEAIKKGLLAFVQQIGLLAFRKLLQDTDKGVPQGAGISPLLANVFLHYVLDLWVHQWRRRHAHGRVIVVRYADDFVMGFQHEADARRLLDELRSRLARFKPSWVSRTIAPRPKTAGSW